MIVEQVANGVAVRMAVLYLLLAGERRPRSRHDDRRTTDAMSTRPTHLTPC